jgi:SAM-dependent methyltransferase
MRSLDCQVDYWNDIGPSKTFAHPPNLGRLARYLPLQSRILDYGCGYGRVLGVLEEQGYADLIGVDPAPAMIARARSRHPNITFELLTDPPAIPLAAESVDAVLLFAVLTCIPTDDGQRGVISEVSRVLRPGGLLNISDLWIQTDLRNLDRYALGLRKYGTQGVFELPEGVVLRHQEPRSFETLTTGYETLALDHLTLDTMNGHQAKGFQWFGRKSGAIDPGAGVK